MGKDGRTHLRTVLKRSTIWARLSRCRGEERYRRIAEDYADIIAKRKADGEFKTSLVVAPTHAEIRHVTAAIRDTLKESRQAPAQRAEFTVLRPRNLTEAERTDAPITSHGRVVQFHQNAKGFKRGERVTVVDAGAGGASGATSINVTRSDGSKALLPFSEAKKFQVYRPEKLSLAEGDKLRITHERLYARNTAGGWQTGKTGSITARFIEVEGFTAAGRYQAHQWLRRARRITAA